MGWEQRGNQYYYYYKVREGGRVRSKYMGKATYAQLCARLIENDRLDREDIRSARLADAEIDRQLATAEATVFAITKAKLLADGYHKHHGQWRKRHAAKATASNT